VIELFNPWVKLLARDSGQRYGVGEYEDLHGGDSRVFVTEETWYEAATQVSHIRWFFQTADEGKEIELTFAMRQFFPQEIDALLWYNGFLIEQKYGGYDEQEFASNSPKQLIVCHPK
jgi:hypothetical protein